MPILRTHSCWIACCFLWLLATPALAEEPAELHVFGWWHAPSKYVITFAVKGTQQQIKWNWACKLRPSPQHTTRKYNYTKTKKGEINTRKWGFNWRLSMVWVRKGYFGSCKIAAQGSSKSWNKTIQIPLYAPSRSIQLKFVPVGKSQGMYRSVIVLAKTTQAINKVDWDLRCSYTRNTSKGTKRRIYRKKGHFATGKWRFQSNWVKLRRQSKETGTCRLRATAGSKSRVWKSDASGDSQTSAPQTSDGCELLTLKREKTLQRNFGSGGWKCLAVKLKSGQVLTIRTSGGSWIRAIRSNQRSIDPEISRSTFMRFKIPHNDQYKLRIHAQGEQRIHLSIR